MAETKSHTLVYLLIFLFFAGLTALALYVIATLPQNGGLAKYTLVG